MGYKEPTTPLSGAGSHEMPNVRTPALAGGSKTERTRAAYFALAVEQPHARFHIGHVFVDEVIHKCGARLEGICPGETDCPVAPCHLSAQKEQEKNKQVDSRHLRTRDGQKDEKQPRHLPGGAGWGAHPFGPHRSPGNDKRKDEEIAATVGNGGKDITRKLGRQGVW